MTGKKLAQYRSGMTSEQIAAGMNAAISNASRLAADAGLLLNEKRYPSAVALAILSIEESGKVSILRELALARNHSELSDRWREYRTHTKKNALWPLLERAMQGASKLEDFRELVHPDAEHPYVLDNLKQLSIYSSSLAHHDKEPESRARHVALARAAYSSAARFLDRVTMTQKQSHEVRTTMTSLRRELQRLGERF